MGWLTTRHMLHLKVHYSKWRVLLWCVSVRAPTHNCLLHLGVRGDRKQLEREAGQQERGEGFASGIAEMDTKSRIQSINNTDELVHTKSVNNVGAIRYRVCGSWELNPCIHCTYRAYSRILFKKLSLSASYARWTFIGNSFILCIRSLVLKKQTCKAHIWICVTNAFVWFKFTICCLLYEDGMLHSSACTS